MSTSSRPPRGVTLLQTPFLHVEHDEPRKFVRYTRSTRGFASIAELDDAHLGLIRAFQRLDRPRLNLLVDLRDAPPRNDPAFEQAIARHRGPMMQGFRRVAILVRSVVGGLQVRRHMSDDGTVSQITQDEDEALRYLGVLGVSDV
jgi:hypothetical protein